MVPQKGRATGDTGGEKRTTVVHVSTREASLKRRLRRHLKSLGFQKTEQGELAPPGTDKDAIRSVHSIQREGRLAANKQFLTAQAANLAGYFASGEDIDPGKIRPVLQRIETESWEGDLFRLASLTWSVPVSSGFGRRLRYLVWDDCNGKLIGIIAIGDPVFNLSVRDNLIDWMVEDHSKRLVNIMDAYVLGAVPPYNMLLGGKLLACLLRTRDIYDDFTKAYGGTTGIISKQEKRARLLAITTSSSMGRSSVYNRLKLDGVEYMTPIGYTGVLPSAHLSNCSIDSRFVFCIDCCVPCLPDPGLSLTQLFDFIVDSTTDSDSSRASSVSCIIKRRHRFAARSTYDFSDTI